MLSDDEPLYPDAKRPTVFAEGIEYQDFVCHQLARHHIILQNLASKKYQFSVGENLQGFEIKLDMRCTETGRMSIEIGEKMRANHNAWIPSGIYRNDNSWLYIQGNFDIIAIFAKNWLRRYFEQRNPPPQVNERQTIRTFYLDMDFVREHAIKVIDPKKLCA